MRCCLLFVCRLFFIREACAVLSDMGQLIQQQAAAQAQQAAASNGQTFPNLDQVNPIYNQAACLAALQAQQAAASNDQTFPNLDQVNPIYDHQAACTRLAILQEAYLYQQVRGYLKYWTDAALIRLLCHQYPKALPGIINQTCDSSDQTIDLGLALMRQIELDRSNMHTILVWLLIASVVIRVACFAIMMLREYLDRTCKEIPEQTTRALGEFRTTTGTSNPLSVQMQTNNSSAANLQQGQGFTVGEL
eukprot:SAG31_NODE_1984_length_6740_cov_4.949255_13_plen_248_part_00